MRTEKIIAQLNEVFKGRAVSPTDCISYENEMLFYIRLVVN